MKTKLIIIIAFAFLLWSGKAFAQGCDGDDPVTSETNGGPSAKLFGFLQPEYDFNFTDAMENSFKFKRARIGVRGNIADDFAYYFLLETSPFIGSSSDAYLMDAFVTYNRFKWARASVGTFKQPFGLDVSTPCHGLVTIDRSMVADQLVAPQRDFGLTFLGGSKYTRLNYAVALMNGRGLKVKDDNTKKDVIGRMTYRVTKYLTLGTSFRYGFPIPNNDIDSRITFGGEFMVDVAGLNVQGEYIYDEGAYFLGSGGGCGSTPVVLGERRSGAYILAFYRVTQKFHPVFKYEYFDPDLTTSENASYQERMTVGLNYFFTDMVRLQINYQANIQRVSVVNDDALKAQVQIRF
jgi:phosphate-selective porin